MLPKETGILYTKLGEEYIEDLIREYFEATGEEISSVKVEIKEINLSVVKASPVEKLDITLRGAN